MKESQRKDLILVTTAKLSRWGNSSAIRIPNQLLKQLNLEEGTEIEVLLTPEKHILLRPLQDQEQTNEELREHLHKLLSKIKKDSPRHKEIDLGMEGDEII